MSKPTEPEVAYDPARLARGGPPALSVTGVTKSHAQRAIRYMANYSLAAFYRVQDKSLNAFEFKHGREWTYQAMYDALEATK